MTSLSDRAALLVIANTLKYAVGFVLPMVFARALSQHDYGTYQQLSLVAAFATGVMVLGLPTSIYYFYNHRAAAARGRPTLIAQTQLLLLASGGITAAAIAAGAPLLALHMHNPGLASLLPLYSIYIGLFIAGEHFLHLMISQDRYPLAIGLELAETALRVAGLVILLALGYGLEAIVIMLVVYAAVRLLARSCWLYSGEDSALRASWRARFIGAQLAYSLPLAATMGVGMIGSMLDRAIVAVSFTPVMYAIYSVGALEIPLDSIFQASVMNVLRASLPELIEQGRTEEVVSIWRGAVRKLALIVVPSFIFLLVFSGPFITLLFSQKYAESVHVFRIYLLLVPLHMLVLSCLPQVYGRTRLNLYVVAVAVATNAVLSLVLLRVLGILGPATAFVCSSYLSAFLYFVVALRLLGVTPGELMPFAAIARTALAAILAAAPALGAASRCPGAVMSLAVGGLVFAGAYLAAGYLLGVFGESELHMARSWFRRFVSVAGGELH